MHFAPSLGEIVSVPRFRELESKHLGALGIASTPVEQVVAEHDMVNCAEKYKTSICTSFAFPLV
jgi:hypothetical protein